MTVVTVVTDEVMIQKCQAQKLHKPEIILLNQVTYPTKRLYG